MKDDIRSPGAAKAIALAAKTNISQSLPPMRLPSASPTGEPSGPNKARLHKRVHWWFKSLSRKQFIFVSILFFGLAGGAAYYIWRGTQPTDSTKTAKAALTDVPEPTTVASRMTGVEVPFELNDLPVTGVMIENSPEARPQSGLTQADMVYEAIAEGGITRFLALYQESKPDYIGPVRSVRPYYLDFLRPYDAAIAHAGGSAEALAQIRSQGIKDLDHGANGSTYDRVRNRFAPHNLYTSRDRLLSLQKAKGFNTSTYNGFARKEKDTPLATPTARTIDLTISSLLYNPRYDYDPATNTYKRSQGGQAHTDERSGAQIAPKVVIALVVPHIYSGIYSSYGTNSGGVVNIFQDGGVTTGTWSKADRVSGFVFRDATGAVIPLNPGQTWISLVSSAGAIKYAP